LVILGMADGTERGAALVIDGRLAAVHAARVGHDPAELAELPWAAAQAVLARAGLTEADVDMVAIAGRFTPPLAARRRPRLRARAADPFATARLIGATAQRLLRASGFGAVDAERATEFFEARLRARGFSPRRVVLVDVHRCHAAAAYRCQPDDEALILVLHPKGDGALATVHRGCAGQLDRVELDRGTTGAHLWLDRCRVASGLPGPWTLQGSADPPDPALAAALAPTLQVDAQGRWTGARLARRSAPPWDGLAQLGPHAASTIAALLRERALRWIVAVRARHGTQGRLVLSGAWLRDPRLAAEVAEMRGVERVSAPWSDGVSLAVGAAVEVAGTAPEVPEEAVGAPVDATSIRGVPAQVDVLARDLASGAPVARFVGHDPFTPHGSGARSVVVRADQPAAVARVRAALGRPSDEVPALVALPSALPMEVSLEGIARRGGAAARVADPLPRTHDGWVRVARPVDPALSEALGRLAGTVQAVAAFPLAFDTDRAVTSAAGAIDVWQRAGLPALELGDQRVAAERR
jgi:hypothetical protein